MHACAQFQKVEQNNKCVADAPQNIFPIIVIHVHIHFNLE